MNSNRWVTSLAFLCCSAAFGVGCKSSEQPRSGADETESTAQTEERSEQASHSEPADTETESVATRKQVTTPTPKAHMREHLAQADQLLHAIQHGELEAAREAAAWLAEHQMTSRLSSAWQPHVEAMQNAAREARDAKDVNASAVALGRMGEACASCHREIAGPKIEASQPPEGSDLKAKMALHAWASQQMWLGLMGPSNEAWVRGAEAMAKADLSPDELFDDRSPSPELLELEQTAQELASESRGIEVVDALDRRRGELYSKLLYTCSACHTRVQHSSIVRPLQ